MLDEEEQIVNNKSDVSKLFNNEEEIEEIEYDAASKTSLNSDFDEEDDKFQTPLVVPQQPLIPSRQQPHLRPRLFYSGRDQMRWNIRPPALSAIIPNVVHQGVCTPKGQTAETEIELWELFFNNVTLESITDFTNIKIASPQYLFQCDRDTN